MFQDLFLCSVIASAIAVLWRKTLVDSPKVVEVLQRRLPAFFAEALTCGACVSFWISLLFAVALNPLHNWILLHDRMGEYANVASFVASWMAIGMGTVCLRFLATLLQEASHHMYHLHQEDEEWSKKS